MKKSNAIMIVVIMGSVIIKQENVNALKVSRETGVKTSNVRIIVPSMENVM